MSRWTGDERWREAQRSAQRAQKSDRYRDAAPCPPPPMPEWTEAHQRAAWARMHEMIAELIREGRVEDARAMGHDVESYARSEALFRENLEWFDGDRRDAEVAAIRARGQR